ncbi:MAG: hypothetical protein LBT78_02085, partial [Tannerella sp.]|nr:hypothetical protein [Tannerella sp.]
MRRDIGIYGRKQTQNLSNLPTFLFTLFICLCCWAVTYYFSGDGGGQIVPATLLWDRISGFWPDKSSTYAIGAFLLCCMAASLQRANYFLIIIRGKSKLPFLLFLLLNTTTFGFIPLRPVSVAFFFLILCLYELFRAYQDRMEPGRAYKAMIYLGIGSLIWVHLLWFIPLFWYGMFQFRLLNFRSFTASVLGIITTYWILLGWCVWKHDFSMLSVSFQNLTAFTPVSLTDLVNFRQLVNPLAALLMIVTLSVYLRLHEFNVGLRTRQFVSFLLTCGKYVIPFLFLFKPDCVNFLCVFYIPVSLLASYLFFNASGKHVILCYYLIMVFTIILWG